MTQEHRAGRSQLPYDKYLPEDKNPDGSMNPLGPLARGIANSAVEAVRDDQGKISPDSAQKLAVIVRDYLTGLPMMGYNNAQIAEVRQKLQAHLSITAPELKITFKEDQQPAQTVDTAPNAPEQITLAPEAKNGLIKILEHDHLDLLLGNDPDPAQLQVLKELKDSLISGRPFITTAEKAEVLRQVFNTLQEAIDTAKRKKAEIDALIAASNSSTGEDVGLLTAFAALGKDGPFALALDTIQNTSMTAEQKKDRLFPTSNASILQQEMTIRGALLTMTENVKNRTKNPRLTDAQLQKARESYLLNLGTYLQYENTPPVRNGVTIDLNTKMW